MSFPLWRERTSVLYLWRCNPSFFFYKLWNGQGVNSNSSRASQPPSDLYLKFLERASFSGVSWLLLYGFCLRRSLFIRTTCPSLDLYRLHDWWLTRSCKIGFSSNNRSSVSLSGLCRYYGYGFPNRWEKRNSNKVRPSNCKKKTREWLLDHQFGQLLINVILFCCHFGFLFNFITIKIFG